jgi:hypothetical protein
MTAVRTDLRARAAFWACLANWRTLRKRRLKTSGYLISRRMTSLGNR